MSCNSETQFLTLNMLLQSKFLNNVSGRNLNHTYIYQSHRDISPTLVLQYAYIFTSILTRCRSRYSGWVTGYMNDRGTVVKFSACTTDLSLIESAQTFSRDHQVSYSMRTENISLGGESNRSLAPSFGVKNERSYSSSPPYAIKKCLEIPLP